MLKEEENPGFDPSSRIFVIKVLLNIGYFLNLGGISEIMKTLGQTSNIQRGQLFYADSLGYFANKLNFLCDLISPIDMFVSSLSKI